MKGPFFFVAAFMQVPLCPGLDLSLESNRIDATNSGEVVAFPCPSLGHFIFRHRFLTAAGSHVHELFYTPIRLDLCRLCLS
jgi:hypothetical protein